MNYAVQNRDYKKPREIIARTRVPVDDPFFRKALRHSELFPPEFLAYLRANQRAVQAGIYREIRRGYEIPAGLVAVSCSDARTGIFNYLDFTDFRLNFKVASVRVAANVASDAVLASIDWIRYKNIRSGAEPPVVCVFAHSGCGGVKGKHEFDSSQQYPEKTGALLNLVDTGSAAKIRDAESNNLTSQARRVSETLRIPVHTIMLDIIEHAFELRQTLVPEGIEYKQDVAMATIAPIMQANRAFMINIDDAITASIRNLVQTASIALVTDARLGVPEIEVRLLPQTAFVVSTHGKTDLDDASLGSIEYWRNNVRGGNKIVIVTSHYPDVIADRIDQLGCVLPSNIPVYALLSDFGALTPVVLYEPSTGKTYGHALNRALDKMEQE